MKRDDTFEFGGQYGGKVRTCLALASGATHGLVTAGSRHSPQVAIVATIGHAMGLPVRAHMPDGPTTPAIEWAERHGAELVRQRGRFNNVIRARAKEDAEALGWTHIPFGMECAEAVKQTADQVANVLDVPCRRIVVPVGSGMSLAGILHGLDAAGSTVPVVGVVAGADPTLRLDRYAPPWWRIMVRLVPSSLPYGKAPQITRWGDLDLDPVYEAKCLEHVSDDDLLWVVGRRGI